MSLRRLALSLASLLAVVGWAAAAQAQGCPAAGTAGGTMFCVAGGVHAGAQAAIGNGLQLPIQAVAPGLPVMCGGPCGTGMALPNSLQVKPIQTMTVMQPLGGGQRAMMIPATLLARPAPGVPKKVGVLTANPKVFQVQTSLSFKWPKVAATFSAGGRTGNMVTTFTGPNKGQTVTYLGTASQFGGPGQFKITAGAGAAGGKIPGAPVTVWITPFAKPAGWTLAFIARANTTPGMMLAHGGPLAGPFPNPAPPPVSTYKGAMVTTMGTPIPAAGAMITGTVTPMGIINGSVAAPGFGLPNAAYLSSGFPWTTGAIVFVDAAGGTEFFTISGTDMRAAGVGNITMVAGSLSDRTSSGPNVNRAWLSLTLPEPGVVLGTVAALATLGLCHGLVRRRSR